MERATPTIQVLQCNPRTDILEISIGTPYIQIEISTSANHLLPVFDSFLLLALY